MANCFCCGWAEKLALAQCQGGAGLNKDMAPFLVPWLPPNDPLAFAPWSVGFEGVGEDEAASGSKSHGQAEKRRRDRINAQLATLRKLIPKSDKMDKATLLGSVVEHVKKLKRKALEVNQVFSVPTDVDEVTIIDCDFDVNKENIFIKASVCCDDRPELFAELNHALNGLRLTTVQADMTSLGGRIKGIFVLCTKDGTKEGDGNGMDNLKQSLKVVLNRIATSSTASNYHIRSKRQRFFLSSSDHHS